MARKFHRSSTLFRTVLSFITPFFVVMFLFGFVRSAHAEDFAGPFSNWINVKTVFGAKGDGLADDTNAIQAALDRLGADTTTLYFPAGTYRITRTIVLSSRIYVNIVGQDPASTRIIWDGVTAGGGATVVHLDGVAYSRINRLTFDGRGTADVLVDQSWRGKGSYFDTGNEYADDIFEHAGIGFRCGNLGSGCAETAMLRDRFLNNSVAGIALKNFNALDMFVWNAFFRDNGVGVTNNPGAGNFHIFDSLFENSKIADISLSNTGIFNFAGNYSVGSRQFINAGGSNNPANILIEANTVLDAAVNPSVAVADFGPVILLANTIRSHTSLKGPVVLADGWGKTDLFSMANVFTVASPLIGTGHYHSIGDRITNPAVVRPLPPVPPPPPLDTSQIFEVPSGSTEVGIQRAIDRAAASVDQEPVVHIPAGLYKIGKTLVIPAKRPLEIVGEGHQSYLSWTGAGRGPILRLLGPSKAVLSEFSLGGNQHSAEGIEIENADQKGGLIFMESPFLSSSYTNLLVDKLESTRVELHDLEHKDSQNGKGDAISIDVVGGNVGEGMNWKGGRTNIIGGASSGNSMSYRLTGDAHLSVQGVWNDAGGGHSDKVALIKGTGTFFYAGSALYQPACNDASAVDFDGFEGTAALVNLGISCKISAHRVSPYAKIAAIGIVSAQSNPSIESDNGQKFSFWNGQTTVAPAGAGSSEVAEQGNNVAPLADILGQTSWEESMPMPSQQNDVTDIHLHRVFVEAAITGIRITSHTDPN